MNFHEISLTFTKFHKLKLMKFQEMFHEIFNELSWIHEHFMNIWRIFFTWKKVSWNFMKNVTEWFSPGYQCGNALVPEASQCDINLHYWTGYFKFTMTAYIISDIRGLTGKHSIKTNLVRFKDHLHITNQFFVCIAQCLSQDTSSTILTCSTNQSNGQSTNQPIKSINQSIN
jgi:hypothetical protein